MSDISERDRIMQELGEIKEGGGNYDAETIENHAIALNKIEQYHPDSAGDIVLTPQEAMDISDMLDNDELRDLCRAFIEAGMVWDTI